MNALQAVLLGFLQGFTEFLPVSSSGHLVLARSLMGLKDVPVLFDVILHIATLVVVIWVFRYQVWGILKAVYRLILRRVQDEDRPNLVLALKLVVASAFTAVIGLYVSSLEIQDNPALVSALLLVTAAILAATAWARGSTGLYDLGWARVVLLGIAQGIGVFPGISRSGITIGTGMLSGLDRKSAGDFSFLLSIPAVGGAFLLTLKDLSELAVSVPFPTIAAGFLAALAAGYAALKLLLWIISSGRLWIFSIYLVPVGIWGIVHFGLRITG